MNRSIYITLGYDTEIPENRMVFKDDGLQGAVKKRNVAEFTRIP